MLPSEVRTAVTLRIAQIYESIQGEGLLIGTPSVFIRIQGCNLRCSWCDQPESLNFNGGQSIPLIEVIKKAISYSPRHAVITGGEPFTSQHLHRLVESLIERGFTVQIETNGTLFNPEMERFKGSIHITCSPKGAARYYVHPSILKIASELKFVVDEEFREEVVLRSEFRRLLEEGKVVLQPESNRNEMLKKALKIQKSLVSKGFGVRVIPQVHKFLGIP